jgi:peptide-methionine (S)-S-oxide reductase
VDFDPEIISFDELLDVFWAEHSPTSRPWSTQYAHVAFFANEAQRDAIAASRAGLEAELGGGTRVTTQVRPLDRFYVAEDYHQKYYLRNTRPVMREFVEMFGRDEDAFRESTAAARANGLAGGCAGSGCRADVGMLGLSETAASELMSRVDDGSRGGCGL